MKQHYVALLSLPALAAAPFARWCPQHVRQSSMPAPNSNACRRPAERAPRLHAASRSILLLAGLLLILHGSANSASTPLQPDPVPADAPFTTHEWPSGGDTAPSTWRFGGWSCALTQQGRGTCRSKGQPTWRFRLPVSSGRITHFYSRPADRDLLLVLALTDDEDAWATALRLCPRCTAPAWTLGLPVMAPLRPHMNGHDILIAGFPAVLSLEASTGTVRWVHQWQYDGSGLTRVSWDVDESTVELCLFGHFEDDGSRSLCYATETGLPAPCVRTGAAPCTPQRR
jgi:hypothetical protein